MGNAHEKHVLVPSHVYDVLFMELLPQRFSTSFANPPAIPCTVIDQVIAHTDSPTSCTITLSLSLP